MGVDNGFGDAGPSRCSCSAHGWETLADLAAAGRGAACALPAVRWPPRARGSLGEEPPDAIATTRSTRSQPPSAATAGGSARRSATAGCSTAAPTSSATPATRSTRIWSCPARSSPPVRGDQRARHRLHRHALRRVRGRHREPDPGRHRARPVPRRLRSRPPRSPARSCRYTFGSTPPATCRTRTPAAGRRLVKRFRPLRPESEHGRSLRARGRSGRRAPDDPPRAGAAVTRAAAGRCIARLTRSSRRKSRSLQAFAGRMPCAPEDRCLTFSLHRVRSSF